MLPDSVEEVRVKRESGLAFLQGWQHLGCTGSSMSCHSFGVERVEHHKMLEASHEELAVERGRVA